MNIFSSCILIFLPGIFFAQSISVQPDHFLRKQQRDGIFPMPVFTIDEDDTTLYGAGKLPKSVLQQSKGEQGFILAVCPFCPPEYAIDERVRIYFTDIGQPGMRAYVDRNFNHDYTDDGGFVSPDTAGRILIELASPSDPSAVVRMRYKLISKSMDVTLIPLQIFENTGDYVGVKLKDRNLWFSMEPLWIQATDVIIGKDSMCVTFYDKNFDGCFTGAEDMIALFPYGIDSACTQKYRGVRQIEPGLILGFNGHAYEVKCDTNTCQPVTLTLRTDLPPPVVLSVGDQLPHFSVQFFDGDSVDVYTAMQAGKYTYIEFWGTWCGTCRLAIPTLKSINDTLGDRVTIISLDAYDDRERVKEFVKENQMTWPHGYSNSKIEEPLYAGDGYPYGILVDPSGKIVAFDVSAGSVAEMIPQK